MKSTIKTPQLAVMSLALCVALGSLATPALAVSDSAWVGTRTQAFLPAQQVSAQSADGVSTMLAQDATEMRQGDPVHVVLSLNLRNQAQLAQYLRDLQQSGSPSFGKFLTPAQFTERYAATPAQAAAVVAHLRAAGFVNIKVAPNRQLISAQGTAATVQAGFRTGLKRFTFEGRNVHANTAAAQVPAALGSIVGSVLGLQNVVIAQTHHRRLAVDASVAQAALAGTGVATTHNPVEFSALYGAGSTPTASNTTVGIISSGDVSQTLSDLQLFTEQNGLDAIDAQVVRTGPDGSNYDDTGGVEEWNLDSQAIVGAAGGKVNLIFYTAPTMEFSAITASYNNAVTDNIAKVINVSLGSCETYTHDDGTQEFDNQIFQQAIAQGQTFSVSTGDAGTYNCSVSRISGSPGLPKKSAYDVSEPANSPYVIAVGGTTLLTSGSAYASETVWNEGLHTIGTWSGGYDATKRLWATGGGFSKYQAAPSWQAGVTGNASYRGLPDIAFDAAQSSGANVIVRGVIEPIGGTSLSAPIFSGIWARLQSANNNSLGFPAASFYKYLSMASNAGLSHDITSGNNGSGGYGYNAKKGWDATTGWGSLNIAKLNAFIQSTPGFSH